MSLPSHLYLIDGYGFVFRAYHVLPPLTNPQGTPVGAVYGFTNMILKLRRDLAAKEDAAMVLVLDAGRDSFRNEMYDQYKANRPEAPEDLKPQFPIIREAGEALELPVLEAAGYEADDIIATLTRKATEQGVCVTIISSDKDLMQLVEDGKVELFNAMKNKPIREAQVVEKFGVGPNMVLDVLSLMGDSSDNIPGVPGIGPKTAADLLKEYGSLENLLANAVKIPQAKRRETLLEHAENARLSKQLATLHYEVPVETDLTQFRVRPENMQKLGDFLQKQGFKSLATKLGITVAAAPVAANTSTVTTPAAVNEPDAQNITMFDDLVKFLEPVQRNGILSLQLIGNEAPILQIATQDFLSGTPQLANVQIALPSASQNDLFGGEQKSASSDGLLLPNVLQLLTPILHDPSITLISYDAKKLIHALGECECTNLHDVQVMAFTLDGTRYSRELPSLYEQAGLTPKQDAFGILRLYQQYKARITPEKKTTLYERIERPLVQVLAKMEARGITVNKDVLVKLSADFTEKLNVLESDIHTMAGTSFNIGSSQQVGDVLFNKLGLPGGKKGKSGAYKTDVSVLETLAEAGNEIASKIINHRMLSKLKSTYTESLQKQINPRTGRVHTTFAMTVANTGRLSSNDPNLQNIPIREAEGRKIREAFIAGKGKKLIGVDYSQVELRLLAHIADLPQLKAAFKDGRDIHAETAAAVFNTPRDQVTPDQRRAAKAVNFGIIYGQSAFGLAGGLGISRHEAAAIIEAYFKEYPGIKDYMEATKKQAKQDGYVTTLYNRLCHLPGIGTKGPMAAFAERAAINAPLQGTAADIIKRAMVEVEEKLSEHKIPAQMLLQVHDELILEADEAVAEETAKLVKKIMENVVVLSVPLEVDAKVGNHWGEIH